MKGSAEVETTMPEPAATWTLSGFGDEIDPDPRIQVAVLKALGANHIEVRSAWGTNVVDLDDEQLAELTDLLRDSDMGVSAVASPIGKVDVTLPVDHEVARLRRVIRVAQALNCRYIRIFSFFRAEGRTPASIRDDVMERMRALAAEAEAAEVILLHENEKDIYGDTPHRVADIMQTVSSPALRVAWDSANFVQVGVAHPHDEGFELLRPHLEYLQVKDADASTGRVVPAGQGDGQVLQTVQALAASGYDGYASLEPHLHEAHTLGGFSGPTAFGEAARAFAGLCSRAGVTTR